MVEFIIWVFFLKRLVLKFTDLLKKYFTVYLFPLLVFKKYIRK